MLVEIFTAIQQSLQYTPFMFLCIGVVILGIASWSYLMLYALIGGITMPFLDSEDFTHDTNGEFPRLSIILAACNEAETIEPALQQLLQSTYPHLEIIAVNDRSTDETGDILERISAVDKRVKTIHIETLPPGWLGKVHALHTATHHATGDFLLFTDADIHFRSDAFSRAISYVQKYNLDHLTLMPEIHISEKSQGLERILSGTMIASFAALFLFGIRPQRIASSDPKAFAGVGAFNLVRRSAFQRTSGFEWLKMEVIDDVGLGMMMKQAGMRCGIANGQSLLHLEWYPSLQAIIKGFEKNFFAGFGQYRWSIALKRASMLMGVVLFPWLAALIPALFFDNLLFVLLMFCVHIVVPFLGALIVRKKIPVPEYAFAAMPLGFMLVVWAILRSAWKTSQRGGIEWRGTFYPIDDLRAAQRVKIKR